MLRSHKFRSRFILLFCLLSFAVMLLLQVNLTVSPIIARPAPVEPDDAYGYILKAEQMRADCFLQDCPALNDLRPQLLEQSPDLAIAYQTG